MNAEAIISASSPSLAITRCQSLLLSLACANKLVVSSVHFCSSSHEKGVMGNSQLAASMASSRFMRFRFMDHSGVRSLLDEKPSYTVSASQRVISAFHI
mgnify:CR=1 FL=1